jgi:hypothetical protein
MAPPTKLLCRDLKAGDIMLQFNQGNAPGKAIAFGQAMAGDRNSEIIHAGVMFDNHYIVEALSKGIMANDIRVKDRGLSYRVYRPHNALLGTTAGNVVKFLFDQHSAHGNLKYSYFGAVASLGESRPMSAIKVDKRVDDILSLKPTSFYCSQFVVMSYQLAGGQMGMTAESVFDLDDAKMPPGRLATCCERSVALEYAGYMVANER